jgi:hypothetical protein
LLDKVSVTAPSNPLDYRAIARRSAKHWQGVIHPHLTDLHGRILVGALTELNPTVAAKLRDSHQKPTRKLEHFTIGEGGAWRNVGSGHSGETIIELVQFLAYDCDRRAAAEWLDALTSRIVEVRAA